MSAQCSAAGIFPPSGHEIWKNSLHWQPIPIHTIPLNEDYLVYQGIPCKKVDKMFDELMESDRIKALLDKYSDLIKYLEEHTGNRIRDLGSFYSIYDTLTTESLRGLA